MQFVLLTVLLLGGCVSATYDVESLIGYHTRVAIPMAMQIKEAEEAILAYERPYSRVAGGNVARPHSHPYLAPLLISYVDNPGIGVCGSVLVTRNRLVTAAHCWSDTISQASRFVVVLGSEFLFSGGDRIATTTVVTYPEWDPALLLNNLAIIYLPNPVILTNKIQPIALASNINETFVGFRAIAAGFGRTRQNQTSVPVLSVVSEMEAPVISIKDCQRVFPRLALPNTLCTDGAGGVGMCKGNGGGPLVIIRNGRPLLIGIGTFQSTRGCEAGTPTGFSRITSFYDFIVQNL